MQNNLQLHQIDGMHLKLRSKQMSGDIDKI